MIISTKTYNIISGKEWSRRLNDLLAKRRFSSAFILCDENTLQYCLPLLVTSCPELAGAQIIEIESGEPSKSIEVAVNIWHTLSENEADRHALLVNLGGGVVTDLGGFCSSVYKRGVSFINIPTSLLAMADASVGSKTGVDFAGIKNLLGTFRSPEAVFINPAFLTTLPERHFANGMAEILKIALVSDARFWRTLIKKEKNIGPQALIEKAIILKKKIVQKDPLDKGLRNILNFGHTIGHAIESIAPESGRTLLHGEAVAIGMILEAHIAWQKKLIGKKELAEVRNGLAPVIGDLHLSELSFERILMLIKNDKKTAGGISLFALINGIGTCEPRVPVTGKQVQRAVAFFNANYV